MEPKNIILNGGAASNAQPEESFEQYLGSIIKRHPKLPYLVFASVGILLVMIYCISIGFYPSGLTLSDTLFFISVCIIFTLFYSFVSFGFFTAAITWLAFFNWLIHWVTNKITTSGSNGYHVPKLKIQHYIIQTGILSNIVFLLFIAIEDYSPVTILINFSAIASLLLLTNIFSATFVNDKWLNHLKGSHSNSKNVNFIKLLFFILIYLIPLLLGQLSSGITEKTFEIMSIRQLNSDITVSKKHLKTELDFHYEQKLSSESICNANTCLIKNATILFTGVGTSTRIKLIGERGHIRITIPNNLIYLTSTTDFKTLIWESVKEQERRKNISNGNEETVITVYMKELEDKEEKSLSNKERMMLKHLQKLYREEGSPDE